MCRRVLFAKVYFTTLPNGTTTSFLSEDIGFCTLKLVKYVGLHASVKKPVAILGLFGKGSTSCS